MRIKFEIDVFICFTTNGIRRVNLVTNRGQGTNKRTSINKSFINHVPIICKVV